MIYRIFGALLVFGGCGGFGFLMARSCRREERQLREYIRAMEYMLCELEYRATPLPQLCRKTAAVTEGELEQILSETARRLELGLDPEPSESVAAALDRRRDPGPLDMLLRQWGSSLGCFDLEGQRRSLEGCLKEAETVLRRQRQGLPSRVRSYQTLGLCAGAALTILFF